MKPKTEVLVKRREMTMKSGTFTVKLGFAYSAEEGIHTMKVLEINGPKGEDAPEQGKEPPKQGEVAVHVQSTKGDYVGTICTTIILTKSNGEPDPCAWVWNPILRRWIWRCWNGDKPPSLSGG